MTTAALDIERHILIRAPRSRVWLALTASQDFAKWFSAEVHDSFEPGKRLDMVSTYPGCQNQHFYFVVERMEPEHTFSWKWHPGSANSDEDGTTLVEFHLEENAEGTLVTVTETGFDRISLARRAKALEENTTGWGIQLQALLQYVGSQAV